ncbi:MAG: PD40 domain-containing protein [Deltaproteobacteria bacterium]|nr:PD40 domain-containing protein [Deltaproteobacteria bacterium]
MPGSPPDGETLYFASDRGGGLGSYDIWVASRECP